MRSKPPYLVVLTLILLFIFGPGLSGTSSASPAQKTIDPVCVDFCREQLYQCILINGDENRCLSVYKKCIARCKH